MDQKKMQFSTIIRNEDFIVRDHRVYDVRIMPGVTFLDIIYRFLKAKGFNLQTMALKNILFKQPVATTESHDRKIRILFQEDAGKYLVKASSQSIDKETAVTDEWEENLECELHLNQEPVFMNINVDQLKRNALKSVDLDTIYNYARNSKINHYEFMKGLGTIYQGDDYLLAEIHLSRLAMQHKDSFVMHPAYLDSSTLVPVMYYFANSEDREELPYIPIYIESFQYMSAIGNKSYVYVRRERSSNDVTDVFYNDLEIYNEEGRLCLVLKKLTSKHIRSKELITRLIHGGAIETETPVTSQVNNIDRKTSIVDQTPMGDIGTYITGHVAKIIDLNSAEIDTTAGFYELGLDSQQLLQLVRTLEDTMGEQLYPTLLFEYNTIEKLEQYLTKEYGSKNFTAMPMSSNETIPQQLPQNQEYSERSRDDHEVFLLRHNWQEKQLLIGREYNGTIVLFDQNKRLCDSLRQKVAGNVVLVQPAETYLKIDMNHYMINSTHVEDMAQLFLSLQNDHGPYAICYNWDALGENINERLNSKLHSLLWMTQTLMVQNGNMLEKIIITHDLSWDQLYDASAGFIKTMQLEHPKYDCRIVNYSIDEQIEKKTEMLSSIILRELDAPTSMEREIVYQNNIRYVKSYQKILTRQSAPCYPFARDGGVYLITGGSGGLGLIAAKALLEENPRITIILTGRSVVTDEKKEKIESLKNGITEIIYIQSDVGNREDTFRLIDVILKKYHRLNGVLHAAGVLQDALILRKKISGIEEVAMAKIAGTLHLDEATKDCDLDYFTLFSSTAAVLGNVGQADYAFSNSFMDSYAAYRSGLCHDGKRKGHSLSINWPLWEEGGMQVDISTRELMKNRLHIVPLKTTSGISALKAALQSGENNIVVFEGHPEKALSSLEAYYSFPAREPGRKETVLLSKGISVRSGQRKNSLPEDAIAVVGVSGKYPQAENINEYWSNLKNGKDCITEIPADRWSIEEHYSEDKGKEGKTYSKWGGFIDNIDKFDPLFFNISPRDAMYIDPQERLFLEVVWGSIEDAGFTRSYLENVQTGVFVGAMWGDYQLLVPEHEKEQVPPVISFASIANRVSYCLNLQGPSIAMDTMCSSSLTTIHMACESIRRKESDVAIAGGVNLSLHPNKYRQLSQRNFLSSDGKCRSFGAGGDGYVPGEGVGAVILKPLEKAIEDGDNIYAVIISNVINHNGRTGGYAVPCPNAQAKLISRGVGKAGIAPDTISYLEAHGTGTALGDPIEFNGLLKAFQSFQEDKEQYCSLGSVKSNIGHLESAAGVAGVTKILLQMKHKQLVPTLHSGTINPNLDFEQTPFYLQHDLAEWKRPLLTKDSEMYAIPRRAAISSFGAGGANAFIIFEEYNNEIETHATEHNSLFILSAKDKEQLAVYQEKMLQYLRICTAEADDADYSKEQEPIERKEIDSFLLKAVAELLHIDEAVLDFDEEVSGYGIDAVALLKLSEAIRNRFQVELDQQVMDTHVTLEQISGSIHMKISSAYSVQKKSKSNLTNILYTLQVGREAMEERLAIVVRDIDDLIATLERIDILAPIPQEYNNVYRGSNANKETMLKKFTEGDFGEDMIDRIIARGDIHKTALLWCEGVTIPWKDFYQKDRVKKISLPTYPFKNERYWVQVDNRKPAVAMQHSRPENDRDAGDAAIIPETVRVPAGDIDGVPENIKENILAIIAKSLQIEKERFDLNVDLAEYGLDSLSRLQIINAIKNEYIEDISPEIMYQKKTINEITGYIVEIIRDLPEKQPQSVTDFSLPRKTVTDMLPGPQASYRSTEQRTLFETKNILINGTTGVLGGRLVRDLLETTDSMLYCLVRSENLEHAKERLKKMLQVYQPDHALMEKFEKNVVPVVGDITREDLGLSPDEYTRLAGLVDMIIHSAGKISLHGLYEDVKDVNVEGTTNMINFALATTQKYFIHISTIAVMGSYQYTTKAPFKETDLNVGQHFENLGYAKSKYESELLVHSARGKGLNYIIIRSGNIMGDAVTGHYPFNLTVVPGLFYDFFKTAIDLELVPDSPWYFDVTPIDFISKSILYVATGLKDIYHTYHFCNQDYKSVNQIIELFQQYGYPIKKVPLQTYRDIIRGHDYRSVTTELLKFNQIELPSVPNTYADTMYTKKILEKAGIYCPPIDRELINRYIEYCRKIGYLDKDIVKSKQFAYDTFWTWQNERKAVVELHGSMS